MPGNPFTDPHWAPDLADTVERVVGKVRSTATDNAVKASRAIVFGVLALMAVMIAIPLLTLLFLGAIRELLGFGMHHARAVYWSYLILGMLLMLGGFLLLRFRHKEAE